MDLTLCDGNLRNLYILCVNVSENARENVGIKMRYFYIVNMPDHITLFFFGHIIHNASVVLVYTRADII